MEEGMPVACFGFTHEGEKITRFDDFEPRLNPRKDICHHRIAESSGPAETAARQGGDSRYAYGSPVVNAARKGPRRVQRGCRPTYRTTTRPPAVVAMQDMHYVTVVNPEMINLWLRDRNAKDMAASGRLTHHQTDARQANESQRTGRSVPENNRPSASTWARPTPWSPISTPRAGRPRS